ncbi:MAG: hypothetical protein P9E67_09770 [Candidatus Competibacter sp.]|nr:hypothetical protein [Candidatus Competibacter sp.]
MAWLWMISVGVTDVQFPVWGKDEYGMWTVLRRFAPGKAGIRAVHEGLLALLRNDQIRFESGLPRSIDSGVARDLRLEFDQVGADFLMGIQHANYRISDQADTVPNTHESQLPLYCPKMVEMLPLAREIFAGGSITVLVLNTRRADDFSKASEEPVAAGPLVAKCLAERLGLTWVDGQGQVPTDLALGTSTWIDILTGDEAIEDPAAQQNVVARLGAAIRAWSSGNVTTGRVVVTISGGMPVLKPMIERVPATCIGQANVQLLDKPDREEATAVALSYDNRVTEREVLRFHCAEALRHGDYAGAYGLASRAPQQPWASAVHDGLGPLLEFPGASLRPSDRCLGPSALTACRIEVRLCLGDVIGALIRLGTFIESSIWELIAQNSCICRLGLQVDRDEEILVGDLNPNHFLFTNEMLKRNARGKDHHLVLDLPWLWPGWLNCRALKNLNSSYSKQQPRGISPRILRNRLIHGTDISIDPEKVRQHMMDAGLIKGVGRPFGENFLSGSDVNHLLTSLGEANLTTVVGGHLEAVLNRVIEG